MKETRPSKKFATLEPQTHQVSEITIKKRWRKLTPTAQDRVKTLLLAVQNERRARKKIKVKGNKSKQPLDLSNDEQEIMDDVVGQVTEKLLARLPRMPFPPSSSATSETHFDFEGTLDRIAVLESQLTSTTQSMKLLRLQIAREEKMLRRDKSELERLKEAGKASERMRKSREGRLHPLAKDLNTDQGVHESENDAEFRNNLNLLSSGVENDEKLAPLMKQLQNHLESIQKNTSGMRPVLEAVDEAQDAVDRFAYRNLNEKQYHAVYGLITV